MKNKGGRPKKQETSKSIQRVPDLTQEELSALKVTDEMRQPEKLWNDPQFRQSFQKVIRKDSLINAITDPLSEEKMPAKAFGYTLTVNDTESDEAMGAMLCEFMRDMSGDDLQKVFDSIMRMKRKAEYWHRNSFAYYAYSNYIEAYGMEPTKHALKTYILDHPRKYKDAPSPEDKSGWTRLWKAVGLENLKSK
jgi:hypothetical protein